MTRQDYRALMEQQLERQYDEYKERKSSIFKRVKFNKKSTTLQADLGAVKRGVASNGAAADEERGRWRAGRGEPCAKEKEEQNGKRQ